jgi:tape measure domain-containing protein
MELARLQAVITADDRQYRQKMDAAESKGRATAKSIGSSFSSLKLNVPSIGGGLSKLAGEARGAFAGAFAGIGTELVSGALGAVTSGFNTTIKAGLDFNKMMEGAGIVFENFAGSVEGAQQHLNDLKSFAKSSPFDLPDLIQASARMQAYGTNLRDVVPQLQNLQNAAALAAGTSGNFTESLDGIVNALGQMRAKGSVSAEEMQQLAERGIPVWELLAGKIKKTVEETRKLSEQGKLRGAPAADALLEAFGEGKFANLGVKLSKTARGRESEARDIMTQQAGKAAEDTFVTYKQALEQLIQRTQGEAGTQITKAANAPVQAGLQIATDLSSGQTTLKDIGRALPQTAVDTVTELKDILSKGIASAWDSVKELGSGVAEGAGVSMGDAAAAGTKKSLQIQSPSQVYIGFGEMAAAGFQIGFENGKKRIRVDLTDLAAKFGEQADKIAKTMEATLGRVGAEKLLKKGVAFGPGFFTSGSNDIDAQIRKQASRASLPPELLFAQLLRESRFNASAKSPVGAEGLAQFMPGTAKRFNLQNPLDPLDSIRAQADYMRLLFNKFSKFGNVEDLALAGYNAGENRPSTLGKGRVPQIAETLGYVKEISAVADAIRQSEQPYQQISKAAPKASEALLRLAELASPIQALASAGGRRAGDGAQARPFAGQIIPGGEVSTTVRAPFEQLQGPNVSLAGQYAQQLDTTALNAKIKTLGDSLKGVQPAADVAGKATRNWADEIISTGDKLNNGAQRFEGFKERLGQGFDDLIGALITGGDRWQDVAKNIAVDFFNSLATEMMLSATGGKYGSVGGLLGGIVGGLFSGFGGFGGKKAGGGSVSGNKMYLVGEQGPELFVPGASGAITPNGATQQLMNGGQPQAGKVINISITVPVSAPQGSVSPQTRQQIATQTAQALNAALQRNG